MEEQDKHNMQTVRLDRRTKLAICAATIVAGASDPASRDEVKQAVDGAFLIEAEIETKISGRRR